MPDGLRVPLHERARSAGQLRRLVDEQDPEAALEIFAQAAEQAGTDALVVHARKAYLQGLSPKENREVPPLRYEVPLRLKREHPELTVHVEVLPHLHRTLAFIKSFGLKAGVALNPSTPVGSIEEVAGDVDPRGEREAGQRVPVEAGDVHEPQRPQRRRGRAVLHATRSPQISRRYSNPTRLPSRLPP